MDRFDLCLVSVIERYRYPLMLCPELKFPVSGVLLSVIIMYSKHVQGLELRVHEPRVLNQQDHPRIICCFGFTMRLDGYRQTDQISAPSNMSECMAQWQDRCSKLTLVTSEVVGSIPSQTHSSCDRVGHSL
jgi:hypothetical protein